MIADRDLDSAGLGVVARYGAEEASFRVIRVKGLLLLGVEREQIRSPPRRITEIVHGKSGITADTEIGLTEYLGTSKEFWMNLQSPSLFKLLVRKQRSPPPSPFTYACFF